MAQNYTFPHTTFDVRDDNPTALPNLDVKPLHQPIFFVQAERGPVGVPVWAPFAEHKITFGEMTFTEGSPYYNHQTTFATFAMRYQAVWIVRLAPDDAKTASLVLEAAVTTGNVTQYQKAADGTRLVDANGDWIPETSDGTTPVTQPGLTIAWHVRALTGSEKHNQLLPQTSGNTTTYPVLGLKARSPGAALNNTGFRLYYAKDYPASAVAAMKALTYRFEPVQLNATNGIVSPVRDVNSQRSVDVAFKPGATDTNTDKRYDIGEVLRRDWFRTNFENKRQNTMPYDVFAYSDNVKTMGERAIALEADLTGLDPFQVNLVAGLDTAGVEYDHIVVNGASTVNEEVVLYLQGGSDGAMSPTTYNGQVETFLSGVLNPDFKDFFRYPVSHVYDSGFPLATKKRMAQVFAIRDDVKLEMCTQDVALAANDKASDQSTGMAVRSTLLLYPESTLFGTQTMRASVYQQAGVLNESTSYRPLVPFALDRLIKRCIYDSADYTKGSPKGRPGSEVTIFDLETINWTPNADDQKQQSWDTGLNWAQYCDTGVIHYADLRSIYPVETSNLSDDVLVDRLVYLKHIARRVWTIYTGRTDDPTKLFDNIAKDIDKACAYAFGSYITTTTTVYQTAYDASVGYQTHVEIKVTSPMPNRVWKIIVPVTRPTA